MIPAFTAHGLLPEGIHRATPEEFERRFAYFDVSDRRYRLMEKLRELYRQAQATGIVRHFLVGGSFVTVKAEPNDFDCILVIDRSVRGRRLRPMEYNITNRHIARRTFGGDVAAFFEDDSGLDEYVKFFQTTRDEIDVGIVEIEI